MKVTPETLTDIMVLELRAKLDDDLCDPLWQSCQVALHGASAGDISRGETRKVARQRICAEINARVQDRCPGRLHRRHVLAVCAGSCCTACGGPIDEDGECRCDGAKP